MAGIKREGLQSPLIAPAVGGQIRGIHPPLTAREALYDFMEPNRPPTAALREAKETTKLKYKRSGAGDAGLIYEQVLCAVIFINVFSFVLSTVCVIRTAKWSGDADECTDDTASSWPGHIFDVIEVISVILFTIEYFTRLAVIGVNDEFDGPMGHLKYILSPFALVDLASILPYYLDLITPADDIPGKHHAIRRSL